MSDLTKFSDGASILQQVDVSDIFKNLALGIAEAQQKLDDNSIAQAIKLAETQINGVSLLELGFAPVFYAFQYADISASINLKMALKESLEFGFGLDLQIAKNKGYSEDTHNFLSEDSYSETTEEYKSSRQVSFRAKEKNSMKIENKFFKLSEELDAKSRVEKLKEDIIANTSVDQIYEEVYSEKLSNNQSRGVDVWIDNGFLRIEEGLHYAATNGVGILKVRDYTISPATSIDVDGTSGTVPSFLLQNNLVNTLTTAVGVSGVAPSPSTQLFGLSKSGKLYVNDSGTWKDISSTMYFAFNSDEISYNKNLHYTEDSDTLHYTYPTGTTDNQNHTQHHLIHKILRLIQSNDPDASISITGKTDPKGGNNPNNQSLAKRRAEKLRDHIFGTTAPVNVKTTGTTNASGPSKILERYASIELDCDYIIFIGGGVTKAALPAKTESSVNKFIYADDVSNGAFNKLNVKYGSTLLNYSADSNFEHLISYVEGERESFSYEKKEENHYFLDDESIVKFSMYTNQSDSIEVEHDDESSSSGTEASNSFLTSKTKNEKSLLNDSVSNRSQDSSFALGASVDFRMSRQFEMSMEGNAAMSARLVAVPAPQDFVGFLRTVYVSGE